MFTNFGSLGKLVVLLAFRRSKRERGRLPALPSAVRVERDRQGAKKERKDNLKKRIILVKSHVKNLLGSIRQMRRKTPPIFFLLVRGQFFLISLF